MNEATIKYLADTLRLLAAVQLAIFTLVAVDDTGTDWFSIGLSALAAAVLIGVGVMLTSRLGEACSRDQ